MKKDRRYYMRLERNAGCTIYANEEEIRGHILDISQQGIAFEAKPNEEIKTGDKITITVCDMYNYINQEKNFVKNVTGYVKDIRRQSNGKFRYGCYINDNEYTDYVQELYIMVACNTFRKDA